TQSPVINGYIFSFGSPAHVTLDTIGRIVIGDGTSVIRVDDMTGANWVSFDVGTSVQGVAVGSDGTTYAAGTTSSTGSGVVRFDDNATGAGLTAANLVSQTGGIYAVPVPNPVPALTLAPTSLAFGKENTGTTSAGQNITLTNFGAAPLNIASIATT